MFIQTETTPNLLTLEFLLGSLRSLATFKSGVENIFKHYVLEVKEVRSIDE